MPLFNPHNFKNSLSVGGQDIAFSDPEIANYLNPSGENYYVSATKALHNSDLYSVISTISGDLASSKLVADKPQIQSFLDNPSATTNGHAFWQAMFSQLLIAGESFAYIWRNRNGMIARLEYLRPSQVSTFLQDDGNGLVYTITFDEPDEGVLEYEPQSNVLHFRLMSNSGGMVGISPLNALHSELEIKKQSNHLTLSALAKSILAPGVLKETKGGLLDAKMKAARSRQFMQQVNHSKGGPIVIDDLEEWTPLEIKNDIAGLLSQTDWTSKQIAKVYGIPDSYLNGQGDQQSSLPMIQGMYSNALNRYAQAILAELNDKFTTHISINLRPAIDANGDTYADKVSDLKKANVIDANQALWLLKDTGYFSEEIPDPKPVPVPTVIQIAKGGEKDESEDSDPDQK
ncbi:portal protein [Loigolactobacillus backii]|uniref:Portal protein n=1 Tax=Loigolactobacillus backii TaxID=375175 RepID=A0A192H3I1_9LACO|nr:phage portal protein [Loigolactobacillus backii]ANK63369.1 portal protein [Loigolactobacillus backii]ANK69626.1 portal protein [Loigolactobacillus backii]